MDNVENIPTAETIEDVIKDTAPTDPLEEYKQVLQNDDERRLALKVIPLISNKVQAILEVQNAKKLTEYLDKAKAEFQKRMEEELQKIRDSVKPPSLEEMEVVLSQEYKELTVNVQYGAERTLKTFTLRELPQAVELKFVKLLDKKLVPMLKNIQSLEFTPDQTMGEKLQKVVGAIPNILDILAETCAICLDPYGDQQIDKEWVQKYLSSARITEIIEAQVMVGRFRDFFSSVSKLIPQTLTI